MENAVYLYVNPMSKKHEKTIVPEPVITVIFGCLQQEANDNNDHQSYKDFRKRLDEGERIYCDDSNLAYIQKVFPLQVNAYEAIAALSKNNDNEQ